MGDIITTIWLTITIWTIIPNLLLVYKFFYKKVKTIYEAGFIHFVCLFFFIIMSIIMTGNLLWEFLN